MATNTIAGCNLAQIAEESLPALQSLFAPIAGVVSDFSADIAQKGSSITTRYATKPTAVDLSSGYTSQNTTLTEKTVTLNTFYGFVYGFKDTERSMSSVRLNDLFIEPSLQGVGDKVFGDLWNLVTASNFATSTTITAANFDRDDLPDIGATLTATKFAPKSGRTVWMNPTYYASLLKTLNDAEVPGITSNKAEAVMPRVVNSLCVPQYRCSVRGCVQRSRSPHSERGAGSCQRHAAQSGAAISASDLFFHDELNARDPHGLFQRSRLLIKVLLIDLHGDSRQLAPLPGGDDQLFVYDLGAVALGAT